MSVQHTIIQDIMGKESNRALDRNLSTVDQMLFEEPEEKKVTMKTEGVDAVIEDAIPHVVPGSELGESNCLRTENKTQTLSKNQLRKVRKREKWLANLPSKRAKGKERAKQRKLNALLNDVILGPSRKELKHSTMEKSNCKVRIVIDMSFDDVMMDQAIGKCIKQLLRCYSLNRRAKDPLQFYVTSFNGKSKEEMNKHDGYKNWDVHFQEETYMELFDQEDLVYLTSESDNVITTLDDSKVYIIGGLVDHNAHKGLCYQIAQEKGIGHGRLPIGEFLKMQTRKVLTIDHVFEIMLAVSGGTQWKDALLQVLPSRKGAVEIEIIEDPEIGMEDAELKIKEMGDTQEEKIATSLCTESDLLQM